MKNAVGRAFNDDLNVTLSKKQRLVVGIAMSVGLLLFAKIGPSPYNMMVGWTLVTLLVIKLVQAVPFAFARSFEELKRGASWYESAKSFLSPSLRSLLCIEIGTYKAGLCAIAGLQRPSQDSRGVRSSFESSYSLHNGALSTTIVPLVILGAIVELPLVHLAIHVWSQQPVRWHMILATLTCLGLVWAVGDRSLVKASRHKLNADLLSIRVGCRMRCDIALESISSVGIISMPVRDWAIKHGVKEPETLSLTPMDRPNFHLRLKSREYRTEYVRYGVKALAPEHILIYVDDPHLLQRHLVGGVRGAQPQFSESSSP